MAENTQEPTQAVEPQEPQGSATDWKAEARKWEKRAKENSAAAEELARLKAASMSDLEKAEARAKKVEEELKQLKAERDYDAAVREVAAEKGVPESMLRHCATREDMVALADELGKQPTKVAPTSAQSRLVVSTPTQQSNGDKFAELVAPFFKS